MLQYMQSNCPMWWQKLQLEILVIKVVWVWVQNKMLFVHLTVKRQFCCIVWTHHCTSLYWIFLPTEFLTNNVVQLKYKWTKSWNDVTATNFCRNHIKDKYIVGQLCSQIPPVNFKQEITTCVEDIKVSGKLCWLKIVFFSFSTSKQSVMSVFSWD